MKTFSNENVSQLIRILGKVDCRQLPKPNNLRHLVVCVACHEFITKPLGALHTLHSGVPTVHREWWKPFPAERLCPYNSVTATPQQVLDRLKEPDMLEPDETLVFSYLTGFIGNLPQDLSCFLRFVTGSSSLIPSNITSF